MWVLFLVNFFVLRDIEVVGDRGEGRRELS